MVAQHAITVQQEPAGRSVQRAVLLPAAAVVLAGARAAAGPDVTSSSSSSRHLQFPRFSRTVLGTAKCRRAVAVLTERVPLRGTHPGVPEGVQRQVLNVSGRKATAEVSTRVCQAWRAGRGCVDNRCPPRLAFS